MGQLGDRRASVGNQPSYSVQPQAWPRVGKESRRRERKRGPSGMISDDSWQYAQTPL